MNRSVRALAGRPGFTIVTVATLALGFGVNAAVFSLTRTVLLRPLPYRDADRLVQINEANAARSIESTALAPVKALPVRVTEVPPAVLPDVVPRLVALGVEPSVNV